MVSLETSHENEDIKIFGKQLSMHIAASNPLALNSNDIKTEIIQKEQDLISEEQKTQESLMKLRKISLGKINKFKEENSLMSQDWVMEPKKVKDIISKLIYLIQKLKSLQELKLVNNVYR